MDVFPSGHDQDRSIITVTGEIDLATAEDLLARLTALIGPAGRDIGLDLSGVTFIDCAGLRALTAINSRMRANGANVNLTAMSPGVVRLLELVDATRGAVPSPSARGPVLARAACAAVQPRAKMPSASRDFRGGPSRPPNVPRQSWSLNDGVKPSARPAGWG